MESSGFEIYRSTDLASLRTLPRLTTADREVLDRLLLLAPDVALATASAVVRTNQPDLHDLLFPRGRQRERPEIGQLARALVYLGLAIAAPAQGKILPILNHGHLREAQAQVAARLALWNGAGLIGGRSYLEEDSIPDPELRVIVDTLIERFGARSVRDPTWLRAVAYSEAGAFYACLAEACRQQFVGAVDVEAITGNLHRMARTRDLLSDALAGDGEARPFHAERHGAAVARLRRFGWEEHQSSTGRTLVEIAADAASHGFRAATAFAFSDEWHANGASLPTNGHRYFIRPALLPDSGGLGRWAQEERLKPLQKMLAGDHRAETGLRLTLPSVELLLEYAVARGYRDFLDGQWNPGSNVFSTLATRFGGFAGGSYAVTLFPSGRLDPTVGICPVVEVEIANG